jgi:hypothetical protein
MKIARNIFIGLFLISIAVPLIFLDKETPISMLERRALASVPQFQVNGKLNTKLLETLPRQIEAYVTDRFAGRSQVLFFMNNINFFVLHKGHDDRLLVGKDRWLFYIDKSIGDEFANFKKTNLFNEQQMQAFLQTFAMVNNYCEANNIMFVFMVIPDKCTVYPEKYPFPRPDGMSLVDQILGALPPEWRQKVIFPLDYFLSKKAENSQPLYFNNGLHWTKLGVYYAYELLYEKLKANFPNIPELQFTFTPYMDTGEDNYALWWGIQKFTDFVEVMDVKPVGGWESRYSYVKCVNVQSNKYNRQESIDAMRGKFGIITANKDYSLPTAVVMRDSYFVPLEPFTSSLFSTAEYVWTQPEKRTIEYLATLPNNPDVFIWEIGERGLQAIPLVPPGYFPYD